MGGGVASVAELRKAIEDLIRTYEYDRVWNPIHDSLIIFVLNKVLKLIGEFEAGVRKRRDECEKAAKLMILREVKISGSALQRGLAEELNKVLGGGAARGER